MSEQGLIQPRCSSDVSCIEIILGSVCFCVAVDACEHAPMKQSWQACHVCRRVCTALKSQKGHSSCLR